jgi:hypothetical protein
MNSILIAQNLSPVNNQNSSFEINPLNVMSQEINLQQKKHAKDPDGKTILSTTSSFAYVVENPKLLEIKNQTNMINSLTSLNKVPHTQRQQHPKAPSKRDLVSNQTQL